MLVLAYRDWVGERVANEVLSPFWRQIYAGWVRYHLGVVMAALGYGVAIWFMYDLPRMTSADTSMPISFIAVMVAAIGLLVFSLTAPWWFRYDRRLSDVMDNTSEEAYRFYCSFLEQIPEGEWPATTIAQRSGPSRDELLALAGFGPLHRRFSRHRLAFALVGIAVFVSGPMARIVFHVVPDQGLVMSSLLVGLMMFMSAFLMAPREEGVERARKRFATYLAWEQRYSAQRTLPL